MQQVTEFLQYGELGVLSIVLYGAYCMVGRVIDAFKQNAVVISANTDAINKFREDVAFWKDIRDRLLVRPCLMDHDDQKEKQH
jgi:hypothetical protein